MFRPGEGWHRGDQAGAADQVYSGRGEDTGGQGGINQTKIKRE